MPDDDGHFYCLGCWDAYSRAEWQTIEGAQQKPLKQVNEMQQQQVMPTPPATKRPPLPPWREAPPAKKKSRELTTDEMDALLLGLEAVVTGA